LCKESETRIELSGPILGERKLVYGLAAIAYENAGYAAAAMAAPPANPYDWWMALG
jgi:hypothetical protein